MRTATATISGSTVTIQYPDVVAFAFDTIGMNVSGNLQADTTFTIELYHYGDATPAHTAKYSTYNGNFSADLSGFIQTMMAESVRDPFKTTAISVFDYYPTCQQFTVVLKSGNTTALTFNFRAMWGSLALWKPWNDSRIVYLWSDWPNMMAAFNGQGIQLISGAEGDTLIGSMVNITFERTGRMSIDGLGKNITLTGVLKNTCGDIFLRWIDGTGLPVSWLFKQSKRTNQVTISSSLRSNMDGVLIDDGVNGAVMQIDAKSETEALTIGYALATIEEWEILKGILTSPSVEMWNTDGGYWYRVNVTTKSVNRGNAVKQDFEIQIQVPTTEAQRL